jgi:7 transmembrane sweet-taste receptor of 3 GCPR
VANTTKVKGDLHGGTHIHSPWVFMNLNTNRTWNQTVTVPMIVNHPDDYFVIGTVQLYTGVNDTVAYRWDISSALDSSDGRYIQYQAPYVINEVSTGVLYFSYVAIAVASAILLFLIFQTLRHRNQPVLHLSQGDFLLAFLFAAVLATISAFLLEPKSDAHCRLSYPLLFIPIQLMYAITVGRLWRIHAVISPLLIEHLNKGKTSLAQRFVESLTYISFHLSNLFIRKQKGGRSRSVAGSVKQQISQFQLALVVALFTLPQFVIQLLAFIFQPQKRVIEFNIDESVGRASCDSGVDTARSLITYSFCLLVLLVVILLFMAHSSRKLPSLFNETRVIYDSTFLSVVVMCLGVGVIALTSGPDTSPNVEYLVSLVLVLTITLNSAVRIMMPKLRMVWNGEVIIVSKLVTDHHRKTREKQMENSLMNGVTGFDPSNTNNFQSSFNRDESSPRNGDADQKLLATLHSNSYDTGMMGQRSSKECSERQLPSLTEEPFSSKRGANGKPDDCVDNMIELNVNEGDSEAITALMNGSPTHTPNQVDEPGDETDDHAKSFDDEVGCEAAVGGAAIPSGSDEGATEKRSPSFEWRAQGFLKHAMAKGLTSFRLTSEKAMPSGRNIKSNDATDDDTSVGQSPKRGAFKSPKRGAQESQKRLSHRIIVTEDETPSRRLVLRMMDLQDQLEEINNKIMSGFAVTHEDWRLVTKLTSRLDRTFETEVEFEWDIEKNYKKSLRDVMPVDMAVAVATDSKQGASNGLTTPARSNTDGYATATPPSLNIARRNEILLKAQIDHNSNAADQGDARKEKPVQGDNSIASFAYDV